jgi:hypothetical protein
MKMNKNNSTAMYINDVIALLITPMIICIDLSAFSNLATLNTLNVLNILTDLNADNELFPLPPLKNDSSIILSNTTVPSK